MKVKAGVTATRGSETVLVTEDQSEVRAFAQRVLESLGYRVLVASSAVEALAIGERHPEPIHLLLTDIVMPGMNGRELANQLAVVRPGIRVIFTSGYANELIAQHNLLDPSLVYISKPFSAETLAGTVREVLDAPLQPD